MLQLIERREGVPLIPRPPLPPRRVTRPLLVALGLLALTVAGMLGGLRLAGSTTHRTELGTVSFSVSPSIHGRVDAFVPIANWGARGHAFQAPLTVHVEPRAVNRRAVLGAAAGNGTVLAQSERDARHAARASLLRAYRWAIGGALALGLLLGAALIRRPGVRRGQLIVMTVTPPLCAILIGGAVLLRVQSTLRPELVRSPALLRAWRRARAALEGGRQRPARGRRLHVSGAARPGRVRRLVAAGGRFSRGVPPTHQAVLASDLHDNLLALDAVRREFRTEPLFFPGDFGQTGSADEARVLVPQFKELGRPIVATSGNHDSSILMRKLAGVGVTVLTSTGRLLPNGRTDGKPVQQVLGLRVAGYEDPLQSYSDDPADPKRIFSFAQLPSGDIDFKAAEEQVAGWFGKLPERPDMVLIHENGIAQYLARTLQTQGYSSPLTILTGHDHKQHIDKYGPIVVVDGGSVGAGGPFGISKTSVGFAYLNLTAPSTLDSVDLVETEPFSGAAQADRVVLSAQEPCKEQRLVCH